MIPNVLYLVNNSKLWNNLTDIDRHKQFNDSGATYVIALQV